MTVSAQMISFIGELADLARAQTLALFRRPLAIENKLGDAGYDPVTEADRGAEQAIRQLIRQRFPDHGIRGEEFGITQANSPFIWVIDPIDGTRAFVSGLPVWGVLIGLLENGQPILGLMDQPFTDERFIGSSHGAFLTHTGKQQSMSVRPCAKLSDATFSTTDPFLFAGDEALAFTTLREATCLQRYGLDCYAYAALALGGIDLVVETGLQDYDICGLIPVVEAAGGQISTWSGKPAANGGQIIASGDARIYGEVLEILAPFAKDQT